MAEDENISNEIKVILAMPLTKVDLFEKLEEKGYSDEEAVSFSLSRLLLRHEVILDGKGFFTLEPRAVEFGLDLV